ncbi:hypothetical protein [Microbispora sp. KK1-11]|nr:hypothetical protein [Microbispora sp. KK1-11]
MTILRERIGEFGPTMTGASSERPEEVVPPLAAPPYDLGHPR